MVDSDFHGTTQGRNRRPRSRRFLTLPGLRRALRQTLFVTLCGTLTLLALVTTTRTVHAASPTPVTVFAAASLGGVLDTIARDYTRVSGQPVRFSFGSSATLARQIAAGAPADVFISADSAWMDQLDEQQSIVPASRAVLVGNRLALIAPAARPMRLAIAPGFTLADALTRSGGESAGRLAIADPDSVPAGRYARAALTALGVWDTVSNRLVRGEDVRQALRFVARGEAPLGVVYVTDARAEPAVVLVDVFPAASHPAIVYPMALVARPNANRDGGGAWLRHLQGDAARAALRAAGFTTP